MSNHPFIKANYPHHEGIWGWDDAADQVVMMVRNIRKSMVECEFNLFPFLLLMWICFHGSIGSKSSALSRQFIHSADHDILYDIGCEFVQY
jgi:hypothetical protein